MTFDFILAIVLSQPYPNLLPSMTSNRTLENGISQISLEALPSISNTPSAPAVVPDSDVFDIPLIEEETSSPPEIFEQQSEISHSLSTTELQPQLGSSTNLETSEVEQQTIASPTLTLEPESSAPPRIYEVQPIVVNTEASRQEPRFLATYVGNRNQPVQPVHPMPHQPQAASHQAPLNQRTRGSPQIINVVHPQQRVPNNMSQLTSWQAPDTQTPTMFYSQPVVMIPPTFYTNSENPPTTIGSQTQTFYTPGPEYTSNMNVPPPMMMPNFVPQNTNGNPFGYNRRPRPNPASNIAAPQFQQNQ